MYFYYANTVYNPSYYALTHRTLHTSIYEWKWSLGSVSDHAHLALMECGVVYRCIALLSLCHAPYLPHQPCTHSCMRPGTPVISAILAVAQWNWWEGLCWSGLCKARLQTPARSLSSTLPTTYLPFLLCDTLPNTNTTQ